MKNKTYWENYWGTKAFTSLADDFSKNYEGSIYNHWFQIFSSLQPNSNVIDIACGNMPISVIGVMASQQNDLRLNIHACDVVNIDKKNIHDSIGIDYSVLDQINLYSQINNERLTFKESHFDLVTSMFGFEYSDIFKTLKSVKRILKKSGCLEIVSHFSGSKIIEMNTQIRHCLFILLKGNSVLTTLENLSLSMGKLLSKQDVIQLKKQKKSERLRVKLNKQLALFFEEYGEYAKETHLAAFIKHFFGALIGSDILSRKSSINQFIGELKAHKYRLEDLLQSALDEDRLMHLKSCCSSLKMSYESEHVLQYAGHDTGLAIRIHNRP